MDKRKIGFIVLWAIIIINGLNAIIVEAYIPYLQLPFDPFPFYDPDPQYPMYRISFINLVSWKLTIFICVWGFYLITSGVQKWCFLVVALVFTGNYIEFFLNYNVTPWGFRIMAILIIIPAIIIHNLKKGKNEQGRFDNMDTH